MMCTDLSGPPAAVNMSERCFTLLSKPRFDQDGWGRAGATWDWRDRRCKLDARVNVLFVPRGAQRLLRGTGRCKPSGPRTKRLDFWECLKHFGTMRCDGTL